MTPEDRHGAASAGTSDDIVRELGERSAGTPYRVQRTPGGAVVGLNIADMRYLTLFYRNRLTLAYSIVLTLDEQRHSYTREQRSRELTYSFGSDGSVLGAAFSGAEIRGTVRSLQAGIVGGVHDDGDLVKSYGFDSREITAFVDDVMAAAGWRRRMDSSTRIGMIAAIIGGSVAVLATGFGVLMAVLYGGNL